MDKDLEEKKERLLDELADYLFATPEKDFDVRKIDAILNAIDAIDPIPRDWKPVEESLIEFWEKYNPERAKQLAEEYDRKRAEKASFRDNELRNTCNAKLVTWY